MKGLYPVTDDPTERAIQAFDAFLTQWIPPAMQPHLFDHDMNAAERVRQAIRGIVDQRRLPLQPGPLGYAVFSQHYSREHADGFSYDIESAVFDTLEQATNALKYLVERRTTGMYVIGEVRKP